METKIKNCPFCGAIARVERNGEMYSVVANHNNYCYMYKMPTPKAFVKDAVIRQWNRRTADENYVSGITKKAGRKNPA